ncbi:hypothetical protein VTN96DRAFT_6793 [Rasamsonia emersonii]
MTRKTTVSAMEDYKYSVDAEYAADLRDGLHLHPRCDRDETLPTGLLLTSSLNESQEGRRGLGEDLRRRSSSSDHNTASWESLRGEGSCPSLDGRAYSYSPEIGRVMGSDEEAVMASSMRDDDLVSSPSQTETPLLHPPPSARPSPSPVSQTMTPRGGTRSSSLSSDSSFELPTPLRGRSQPIDIRPSPVRHGLDSTASSNSFRHHSDCDSAILLPRSPPQRVRLPPCPGCFTTAAHQSESEHQTGIHQHTSGLTSEKRQDCACGRSARLHPRSHHHHHPPALKKQTGLPIQNHPANSDVSVLDLGPSFVDDYNDTSTTTLGRTKPTRYSNLRRRNIGEDGNDDDTSGDQGEERSGHHLHRSNSLSNASSSSSESVSSIDNISVASMGGTATLFPIDEDLYEYASNKHTHNHNQNNRSTHGNTTRSGHGHRHNDVTTTISSTSTTATTTTKTKTETTITKEKRDENKVWSTFP